MYDYSNVEVDYCLTMINAGYAGECDGDNKCINFIREE